MTLISSVDRQDAGTVKSALTSPLILLALVCAVLAALLTLKLTLPIGAFYWDLFIYFDAANRIWSGQLPGVDFFTPVGPLGYWLFALFVKLFPDGQPLLIAQWSLMAVTAPLLALVLADVDGRSRLVALALLVPFLVFQILPINVETYYSFPGVDGFGIYNRQMCLLLYVLTAGLVFAKGRTTLLITITGTMLGLFLVKITGFAGGALICAFAFAAGRVSLRTAIGALLGFLAVLALLELTTGVVSAYVGDIAALVALNEGSILPRFLQAASIHFMAFGPLAILIAALGLIGLPDILQATTTLVRSRRVAALAALIDRDVFWLGVVSFAALFVETQNTGGLAFIFVWPVLLRILVRAGGAPTWRLALILSLVAASALPTFVQVIHRGARALVGQIAYVDLDAPRLGTLAAVSQRPELIRRATVMLDTYQRFPEAFDHLADEEQLPSFTLYSEPDFHLTWLMGVEEAVEAIEALEAARDVRFETIMNLNFVNPFPWLLDRQAPRGIAIGADPFRAVPDPDQAVLASVKETDLLLYPLCPVTVANRLLRDLYAPGLAGHSRIQLSPCWDAYVRNELLPPQ
ncbi:hypothetical protein [Aurantimonas coralicida]|uniref:hypothetical protein n=1 Tax=Aurantimonas coralicida TaxID=182270 RepID=UPI0016528D61|nr:hypothetical protein [Aurantimonas coralicida]MBC6716136.1 hypothetical protein [Aurantimonas sp. DM33-3]MCD1641937.1 hypothetical protein [Aurantimonas coralicida]